MDKETILAAIDALDAGKTPVFTTEDVPAFDEEATSPGSASRSSTIRPLP